MFHREAVQDITHWYQQKQRKPLVIRGARQVGKTTSVRLAANYWQPPRAEAQAEVDFLFVSGNTIIPVEVKAGSTGSIKSLQSYIIKKQADLAVRVSSAKPSVNALTAKSNKQTREFKLLNIPFYLINRLEKLIKP